MDLAERDKIAHMFKVQTDDMQSQVSRQNWLDICGYR